jgi:hypothetical protein
MNIVFVTIPRSFHQPYLISQSNALNAIKKYNPKSKIILYSDDDGVADFAKKNNYIAPKNIQKIDQLPLVNSAIDYAALLYPDSYICFINSDILVMGNLIPLITFLNQSRLKKPYILTAYRREANINKILSSNDFDQLSLQSNLILGRHSALDMFIMHSSMVNVIDMPIYRVGRIGWDSWVAAKVRRLGFNFIDISAVLRVIHQDHPVVHDKSSWSVLWEDWYSHGISNFGSLVDCNYFLLKDDSGLKIKFSLKQYFYGTFLLRLMRAFNRIGRALLRLFFQSLSKRFLK